MSQKIIVTNMGALNAKYGENGVAAIMGAVQNLVSADAGRGLDTQLIALDEPNAVEPLGGTAVTDRFSPRQNKDAIDAICSALNPDYLMILGSIDVIPQQELINPMYTPWRDEDQSVLSDLPYACTAPYSSRMTDFVGPTRVVGRLPDITGGADPAYLVKLLTIAARWRQRPASEYQSYFSVCARDWQTVTSMSLEWIFGNSTDLNTCPIEGPAWTANELRPLLHFINCHGESQSPTYYGSAPDFPPALDAARIANAGLIGEGTIGIAECCYGGELYDPAITPMPAGGQPGMANTYLGEGAYAFFASSSVSYGPEVGSAASGLLCQTFAYYLREGASIGRASLQARHDFVQASPILSPIDLKTLAQFNLLGDPSIHCVGTPDAISTVPRTAAARLSLANLGAATLKLVAGRTLRRDRLVKMGAALASVTPFAAIKNLGTPSTRVRRAVVGRLTSLEKKLKGLKWMSFPVRRPSASIFPSAKSWKALPKELHVAVGLLGPNSEHIRRRVALVAYEQNGTLAVQRFLGR